MHLSVDLLTELLSTRTYRSHVRRASALSGKHTDTWVTFPLTCTSGRLTFGYVEPALVVCVKRSGIMWSVCGVVIVLLLLGSDSLM